MPAKIIDGKLAASCVLRNVASEVMALKKKRVYPKLAIILVGKNPASLSYIRQKEKACEYVGVAYQQFAFKEKVSEKKLISVIEKLNKDKNVHGILVQLPLPFHISTPKIIKAINPYKDVDGFHAYNIGKMFLSSEFEELTPCTPAGIIKLLEFYKIPVEGREAVVVGKSNIVGKPLAVMLMNRGATVTVCHSRTKNLLKHTKAADLLFVAVGKPGLIKGNMVKKACVAIDVGFTRIKDKIFGDIEFKKVQKKAKWITPVPGGVGPMTVACLMCNVVRAAKKLTF